MVPFEYSEFIAYMPFDILTYSIDPHSITRSRGVCGRSNPSRSVRIRHRYFPAVARRRGPREQQPSQTEFVSSVRSTTAADVRPGGARPQLGRPRHPPALHAHGRTSPTTGRPGGQYENPKRHGGRLHEDRESAVGRHPSVRAEPTPERRRR